MGFFDEIKKVLFGVKAVSKSAADKAMDKGKETGKVLVDKAEDAFEVAKDKVEDIGEGILDTAGDVWDKAVDVAEDVGGKVMDKAGDIFDDVKDVAEDVGEKVMDVGEKVVDKAKDVGEKIYDKAEDVAKDVKAKASGVMNKKNEMDVSEDFPAETSEVEPEISDVSQLFDDVAPEDDSPSLNIVEDNIIEDISPEGADIKGKVSEIKNDIVEKAKSFTDDLSEKIDDTVEKAKDLAAKEAIEPEYRPHSEQLDEDLLEGADDFFKKAAAFAEGDYDEVRDPFSTEPKIIKNKEENTSVESDELLAGFEDLDGDGNEIVDDAIIVKEDEEE